MEGKKSEPINLTTETNQSEPTSDKLQTTQTNRHRDVLLLSAQHLPIFVPIYMPILCLCKCISA